MAEVVRFLRKGDHAIVRPDLLGLPPDMGRSPRSLDRGRDELIKALRGGDATASRRIVFDAFFSGVSIAGLCERLVAPAMHAIGKGWECGDLDVYEEHRASEVVNRVMYDLRRLLPQPDAAAPTAMGGTPPGDLYRLSSLAVELTLIEAGWNAVSLGSSLPFETMAQAARQHEPELFWLSFTHYDVAETSESEFARFLTGLPDRTSVVIGGQSAVSDLVGQHPRVHFCETLASLRDLATTL